MKLTASMMLTLDGVYQGPGGPDEDRRGGFDRGGWTAPYGDDEGWRFLTSCSSARTRSCSDARRGRSSRGRTGPTTTPATPFPRPERPAQVRGLDHPQGSCAGTPRSSTGDLEAAVRELKAKPGRDLQVHGSGELLRWLLERDLVDELNLRIYPVLLGAGRRLFLEHGPDPRRWSWSKRDRRRPA